jgi:hypothetical protein
LSGLRKPADSPVPEEGNLRICLVGNNFRAPVSMQGMRHQVLRVVLARETRSTPADAHKLAPNLGNIPISELPRLSMQGSGIKCLYIKLKNLQTGKKRTVLTFHRANSSRKYGCGFIQTDRSFEREPASVGVCCALRVGLGRLDFVTVSIIASPARHGCLTLLLLTFYM